MHFSDEFSRILDNSHQRDYVKNNKPFLQSFFSRETNLYMLRRALSTDKNFPAIELMARLNIHASPIFLLNKHCYVSFYWLMKKGLVSSEAFGHVLPKFQALADFSGLATETEESYIAYKMEYTRWTYQRNRPTDDPVVQFTPPPNCPRVHRVLFCLDIDEMLGPDFFTPPSSGVPRPFQDASSLSTLASPNQHKQNDQKCRHRPDDHDHSSGQKILSLIKGLFSDKTPERAATPAKQKRVDTLASHIRTLRRSHSTPVLVTRFPLGLVLLALCRHISLPIIPLTHVLRVTIPSDTIPAVSAHFLPTDDDTARTDDTTRLLLFGRAGNIPIRLLPLTVRNYHRLRAAV